MLMELSASPGLRHSGARRLVSRSVTVVETALVPWRVAGAPICRSGIKDRSSALAANAHADGRVGWGRALTANDSGPPRGNGILAACSAASRDRARSPNRDPVTSVRPRFRVILDGQNCSASRINSLIDARAVARRRGPDRSRVAKFGCPGGPGSQVGGCAGQVSDPGHGLRRPRQIQIRSSDGSPGQWAR
jgi:hypothetical protein